MADKIQTDCPYDDCDRSFSLDTTFVGKKVRCDKCRRRFIVGSESAPSEKILEEQTASTSTGQTNTLEDSREDAPPTPPSGDALSLDTESDSAPSADKASEPEKSFSLNTGTDSDEQPAPVGPAAMYSELPGPGTKSSTDSHDEMTLAGAPPPQEEEEGVEKSKVEEELKNCPQCHGPWNLGQTSCPLCNYVKGKKPFRASFKLSKGTRKALIVIFILGVLGYFGWLNKEKIRDAGGGRVVDFVKSEAAKRGVEIVKEDVVRASIDNLEVKEGESVVITVRQGQPMAIRRREERQIKVEVKTPEENFVGWVAAGDVKEDTEAGITDLLGYTSFKKPKLHNGSVRMLTFRPDGKFIATVAKPIPPEEKDKEQEPKPYSDTVNIWDIQQEKLVRTYDHLEVHSVGFLPDNTVLSSNKDGARIWDPKTTGTLRKIPELTGPVSFLSNSGTAIEYKQKALKLWDLTVGSHTSGSPIGKEYDYFRIASGDKYVVALSANDKKVRSYELPDFKSRKPFGWPDSELNDGLFAVGRNGKTIAWPTGRTVLVVSAKSGKELARINLNSTGLFPAFIDGKHLALVEDKSASIHIYRLGKTPQIAQSFTDPDGSPITAVAVHAASMKLATGHANGKVKFWPLDAIAPSSPQRGTAGTARKTDTPDSKAKKLYTLFRNYNQNNMTDQARKHLNQLVEKHPDHDLTKKAQQELKE